MPDYSKAIKQRNNLSKKFLDSEHLEFLAGKYEDEYNVNNKSGLLLERRNLMHLTQWVVKYIIQCFDVYETNYEHHCMNQIKLLKLLNNYELSDNDIQSLQDAPRRVYFSRHACVEHIKLVLNKNGVQDIKNPEIYTEVYSKITQSLIIEITNYIYNSLPAHIKANEGRERYGLQSQSASSENHANSDLTINVNNNFSANE